MKIIKGFKASVQCGWPKVVRSFKLKEGDICMFTFKDERKLLPVSKRDVYGVWLRLIITKLEE